MPNPDALCPGSLGEGRDAGKCDGWCAATCQSEVYPIPMSAIAPVPRGRSPSHTAMTGERAKPYTRIRRCA